MKKIAYVISAAILAMSVSMAQASDVSYGVAGVKDRVTKANGSELSVAVQDGLMGYGLTSRNIGGTNRTEGDVSLSIAQSGFKATAGVGAVAQTATKSHVVYFAKVGYDYAVTDAITTGVAAGFKNDFSQSIQDRQLTESAHVSYALSTKTAIDTSFTRYNGDAKLNSIGINCVTKF